AKKSQADKQHSELQEARRELQKARLQTARLRSELEAEAEVSEHAAQERAAFSQELRELRSSRSSRSEMASAEETANFRRQPSIQAGLETQIEELRRERQEALQQLQGAKGAEKAARQDLETHKVQLRKAQEAHQTELDLLAAELQQFQAHGIGSDRGIMIFNPKQRA
ncbi:unnamed protein product, partial [Effrenium voratum]